MSISRKDNSPYWQYRFRINEKIFKGSTKSKNKREAEKIEAAIYSKALLTKHDLVEKHITIKEAFELYASVNPNDRDLGVSAEWFIKYIPNTDRPVSELNTVEFAKFVTRRTAEGKSAATIRWGIGFMGRTLKLAKSHGYTVSEIEIPSVKVKKGKLIYYSPEDEAKILAELDPTRHVATIPKYDPEDKIRIEMQSNYDLTIMLLDTGARLREMTTLKWADVDLYKNELHIFRSKVSNESIFDLSDRAAEVLERRLKSKETEWVFPNSAATGPKITVKAIRLAIRRAGFDEGSIHTMRHTFASKLVQAGVPLYSVSQLLGHSNSRTTEIYAHLCQKDIAKEATKVLNNINKGSQNNVGSANILLQSEALFSNKPCIIESITYEKAPSILDSLGPNKTTLYL